MPEQLLHSADVVTVCKEMSCKAVPEAVASDLLMDVGKSYSLFKGLSYTAFVQVMPPDFSGAWIFAKRSGRENKLPRPLTRGIGIFSGESPGKIDMAKSMSAIIFMNGPDLFQMYLKRVCDIRREHCHTVLSALTVTNKDLVH